jgi:hypothetical protein
MSAKESSKALQSAKNNKAPRHRYIRTEILKCGGDKLITYITKMFNKIEKGHDIPKELYLSHINSIYKKGDKILSKLQRNVHHTCYSENICQNSEGKIKEDITSQERTKWI